MVRTFRTYGKMPTASVSPTAHAPNPTNDPRSKRARRRGVGERSTWRRMGNCTGGRRLQLLAERLSQTLNAVNCSPKKGEGGAGPGLGDGLRRARASQMADLWQDKRRTRVNGFPSSRVKPSGATVVRSRRRRREGRRHTPRRDRSYPREAAISGRRGTKLGRRGVEPETHRAESRGGSNAALPSGFVCRERHVVVGHWEGGRGERLEAEVIEDTLRQEEVAEERGEEQILLQEYS